MSRQSKKPKTNVDWSKQVIPVKEPKPCKHVFEFVANGECKCRNCGLGLMGVVDIVDGKPV